MNLPHVREGGVAILGLTAPFWWTVAIGQVTYAIYRVVGRPERASEAFVWYAIHAPTFLLGFVAGVVTAMLCAPTPVRAWTIFLVALTLSLVALAFASGAPTEYLKEFLGTSATWFFFVGSAVWPAIAYLRGRAA